MHVCMYVLNTHVCIHTCMCVETWMHVCMYVCVVLCVFIHVFVWRYMHVSPCMYMHVSSHMYMWICVLQPASYLCGDTCIYMHGGYVYYSRLARLSIYTCTIHIHTHACMHAYTGGHIHMHACMHAYTGGHVYPSRLARLSVYTYIHTYIHTYTHRWTCVLVQAWKATGATVSVCMCVCVCAFLYASVCVCVCVCIDACMHVCGLEGYRCNHKYMHACMYADVS